MIPQKQPISALIALISTMVLAMALNVSTAQAGEGAYMTGRNLALLCSSAKESDQFSCQSYIAGIIDYHRLLKSLGNAPAVDFCIPPDTRMAQIKMVVVNYINRHSEHQDFIAAPGVTMSLFTGFPCKKR